MKKRRSSLKIRVASGRSPAIAILVPGAEPTAASSLVRAASTIPRWYARGDNSFLRLWLLEDRARLFLGGELVLLTSSLQLLPVCKQIEGTAYLQMYPAPSIVVGGVPKIAVGAEGFLNAEAIASLLCSTSRVPVLLFSCDSITLAYRDDDFVIVDLMPIQPEEMKQQLPNAFRVVRSKPLQRLEVVCKAGQGRFSGLLIDSAVREFVKTR
jgi:hypothetical protein